MLYKYLSADLCCVIENLKIRFTQPSALNDPFEAVPLIKDENHVSTSIRNGNEWKEINNQKKDQKPAKLGHELIKQLDPIVGILSLSRTNKNLLLWSHYADSHRGYVIAFDENDDFFKSNHEQGIYSPFLVSYTSQRPVINKPFDSNLWYQNHGFDTEFLVKILGQKPIDWAYEEEVRAFRKLTMLPSSGCCKKNLDIYLVDIPTSAIMGIYLGANMEINLQNKIIKSCEINNHNIPLYKCFLSENSYSIEFKQLQEGIAAEKHESAAVAHEQTAFHHKATAEKHRTGLHSEAKQHAIEAEKSAHHAYEQSKAANEASNEVLF